ncbi:mlh1 [Candida margitis]|uniref:mlh1 n=1 Tax=Candida margitis TaxID=1775924 RepID=UPI002227FF4C|nr:mlh1 [Candida margitis]KAI5970067.1 mlh1 [Candida margitis]
MSDSKTIKKLDESVINKIAAGEIIIQPANALKEMLENSIDAKATNIEIVVKEGGLKLLQITDNGEGINKEDLPLLCERFATSKLTKFEDLESIATYGFRGEALSSISHISRLSVTTKTRESKLAYKAFYLDGKLCTPSFKSSVDGKSQPKPIAGRDGTQITVEDLFYNLPSRFKGLKSKSDEFAKILDVVGRYGVHTQHVGFSCKKFGDPLHQLNTRGNMPLKERIRTVYGSAIANELLDIAIDSTEPNQGGSSVDDALNLGLIKATGAITNANYNNKKKIQPIIFINHRLVSCDPLKRAINSVFQFFLPKGSYPFFYISLEIKPENLDVNVHPTKREVRFLNEDEIIDVIVGKVHGILSSFDTSRKFQTQSIVSKRSFELGDEESLDEFRNQPLKKYRQENKLVRIDANQSQINPFLQAEYPTSRILNSIDDELIEGEKPPAKEVEDEDEVAVRDATVINEPDVSTTAINPSRSQVEVNLESISTLKNELCDFIDRPLTNVFNQAVFVGVIDPAKRLCCFQYDVKLYLCDYAAVLLEFYYQVALHEFCNYGEIQFDEPISLQSILEPLYQLKGENELVPMDEVIASIMKMRDMFDEYFQIKIDQHNNLTTIPMIMQNIQPDFRKLSYFLYRLGTKINYENEKQCLHGILRQIALLYIPEPFEDEEDGDDGFEIEGVAEVVAKRESLEHDLENVLFPEIKKQFLATKNLARDVIQIADLPGLYKVFERC